MFNIERAETMNIICNGLLYVTQDDLTTFQGIELNSAYQFTNNFNLSLEAVNPDASIDDVTALKGLSLRAVYRYYSDMYLTNFNQLKIPGYHGVNTGFNYECKLWVVTPS